MSNQSEIKFKSHTDAYNSAKDFYNQCKHIKNPYVLSVGISVVELGLKSMIEKEMGYLPENLHAHSLRALCFAINELNVNGFKIPYATQRLFKSSGKFYEGGKYFGDNPGRCINKFTDYDFATVSQCVQEVNKLNKEFDKAIEIANEEITYNYD